MDIAQLTRSLTLATALALPLAGHAAEYKAVQLDKSAVTFGYRQMGVNMTGSFKRFAAQLNLDPSRPANAKAVVEIDLASIDVGSAEGNDEVGGKQWFNTRVFPTARFVASGIRSLGGNRFEVTGPLTIKGRTQTITTPATLNVQGDTAALKGSFVLKRTDFAIGEGPWAAFDTVANEIHVNYHLLAVVSK